MIPLKAIAPASDLTAIADIMEMLVLEPWESHKADNHRAEVGRTLRPLVQGELLLAKHELVAFGHLIDAHLPQLKKSADRSFTVTLFVVAGALARLEPQEFKRLICHPPSLSELNGLGRILEYLVHIYTVSEPSRYEIKRQIINLIFDPVEALARADDLKATVQFVEFRLEPLNWAGADRQVSAISLMGAMMASRRGLRELRHHLLD